MFHHFLDWYLAALNDGGYVLIALLMAAESSIIPLPSEVVIPPAAHLAHTTGRFSLAGIVLAGTFGSWLGATIMYWGARLAGRPLVLRFGRYVLVPPDKVEAAERWAARFGHAGVFVSRLLPVIRHLIGIPAGIVRLNYWRYSLFTILGSGIWCAVLCWLGVTMGQDDALLRGELHRVTLWLVGIFAVLGALYWMLVHRHMVPSRIEHGEK